MRRPAGPAAEGEAWAVCDSSLLLACLRGVRRKRDRPRKGESAPSGIAAEDRAQRLPHVLGARPSARSESAREWALRLSPSSSHGSSPRSPSQAERSRPPSERRLGALCLQRRASARPLPQRHGFAGHRLGASPVAAKAAPAVRMVRSAVQGARSCQVLLHVMRAEAPMRTRGKEGRRVTASPPAPLGYVRRQDRPSCHPLDCDGPCCWRAATFADIDRGDAGTENLAELAAERLPDQHERELALAVGRVE